MTAPIGGPAGAGSDPELDVATERTPPPPSTATIAVTLDGVPIAAAEGDNILHVLQRVFLDLRSQLRAQGPGHYTIGITKDR